MSYKHYKEARDAAWRVLLESGINSLLVDLHAVCRELGCKLYSYESGSALLRAFGAEGNTEITDGFTILYRGTPYIFYDSSMPEGRRRFTVAHELGHVALGHLKRGRYLLRRSRKKEEDETQANQFAARLLEPACVLEAVDAVTPEQISELCGVSITAAKYRAERMQQLRGRGRFLTDPLERELLQQFGEFIRSRSSSPEAPPRSEQDPGTP